MMIMTRFTGCNYNYIKELLEEKIKSLSERIFICDIVTEFLYIVRVCIKRGINWDLGRA